MDGYMNKQVIGIFLVLGVFQNNADMAVIVPVDSNPLSWQDLSVQIEPLITSGLTYLQSPYDATVKILDKDLDTVRRYFFPGYDYKTYFKGIDWSTTLVPLRDLYMPSKEINKAWAASVTNKEVQKVSLLPSLVAQLPEYLKALSTIDRGPVTNENHNEIIKKYFDDRIPTGCSNTATISGIFFKGMYVVNYDNLAQYIQNGQWGADIHKIRLLITEYLLGRLAVAAQAFSNGTFLKNPNNVTDFVDVTKSKSYVDQFVQQAGTYLTQVRYMRTMFPSGSNTQSGTIMTTSAKTKLSIVDMFTGLIVINASTQSIEGDKDSIPIIKPGQIGFIPVSGYCNAWTNMFKGSNNSACNGVSFAIKGKTEKWTFTVGSNNAISYFCSNMNTSYNVALLLSSFFSAQEVQPWSLVVKVTSDTSTNTNMARSSSVMMSKINVLAAVKLNIIDFGQYMIVQGNEKNGGISYSLADLWNAPNSLYQLVSKLSYSGEHPFAASFLQGLYNGYLQTSFYQRIVDPRSKILGQVGPANIKEWYGPSGDTFLRQSNAIFNDISKRDNRHCFSLNSLGTSKVNHKKINLNDDMFDLAEGRRLQWTDRWYTPSVQEWLHPESYLDWKFLRTLLVTYAAARMMHIKYDVLPYIEDIIAAPTTNKNINGTLYYLGQKDAYKSILPISK